MTDPVIETIEQNDQGWIRIAGPATMRIGPSFLNCLEELSSHQMREIWIDLSLCEWLDSTFAGCLIGFSQKGKEGHKPPIHINNPSPRCLASLNQLNLDKYLDIQNLPLPTSDSWNPYSDDSVSPEELTDLVIHAHEDLAASDPKNKSFDRIARAMQDDLEKHQDS